MDCIVASVLVVSLFVCVSGCELVVLIVVWGFVGGAGFVFCSGIVALVGSVGWGFGDFVCGFDLVSFRWCLAIDLFVATCDLGGF